MAREWQQRKMKNYVMPDAVYYQSIWAVRDLERMEKRLREIASYDISTKQCVVMESREPYEIFKPTEKIALENAILKERISAIKNALSIVPKDYRSYVLSNIIFQNSGYAFPDKIWRIWKQKFLFNVAKNLSLM